MKLAFDNSFAAKKIKRSDYDVGPYMVANELKGDKRVHGLEIVSSIRAAYRFHEEYYQSSYAQQKLPLLEKFSKSLRHFIYKTPYYRVIEDELMMNELSNDAILHIIRLSVMSKSRKESYDFLDSIPFPEARVEGNIVERYAGCFLEHILSYIDACEYIFFYDDESMNKLVCSPGMAMALPVKDISVKYSGVQLPQTGLLSLFISKVPLELWRNFGNK